MKDDMNKDTLSDDITVFTDVCEYFTEYPDSISNKVKNVFILNHNAIDLCIVLRLIHRKIHKEDILSVIIAKYHDKDRKQLQTFKILVEVPLDPAKFSKEFREDKENGVQIDKVVQERINKEGSFNQMICFTCKDENMRGSGYYSVIVCNATEDEIRNNHDLLKTKYVDDCPFCVLDKE